MMPAGRMINWSALASIGVFDSSCRDRPRRRAAAGQRVGSARWARATPAIASMDATLQTAGECIARASGGSNRPATRAMQSPSGRVAAPARRASVG